MKHAHLFPAPCLLTQSVSSMHTDNLSSLFACFWFAPLLDNDEEEISAEDKEINNRRSSSEDAIIATAEVCLGFMAKCVWLYCLRTRVIALTFARV